MSLPGRGVVDIYLADVVVAVVAVVIGSPLEDRIDGDILRPALWW